MKKKQSVLCPANGMKTHGSALLGWQRELGTAKRHPYFLLATVPGTNFLQNQTLACLRGNKLVCSRTDSVQNNRHKNRRTVNHGISYVDTCTMINVLTNIINKRRGKVFLSDLRMQ